MKLDTTPTGKVMVETYVIKPTITPTLWQVIGSIGNRVRTATRDECIRWAEHLGLDYELEGIRK